MQAGAHSSSCLPPQKRKGRLAIYAQNKDWVLKGKLNVNLCLQYPKNVEKGQPTPPKWVAQCGTRLHRQEHAL